MKSLLASRQYQKDYKLALKRGKDMAKLKAALNILVSGENLPARYRLHKLSGNYSSLWECHIESDWLLIFDILPNEIRLYRLGTHSDLFE